MNNIFFLHLELGKPLRDLPAVESALNVFPHVALSGTTFLLYCEDEDAFATELIAATKDTNAYWFIASAGEHFREQRPSCSEVAAWVSSRAIS